VRKKCCRRSRHKQAEPININQQRVSKYFLCCYPEYSHRDLVTIQRRLFCFLTPFTKDSHKCLFFERFQKMDPELGAMDCGAKVDDMVKGVPSKILHLPPRHRRSWRRRGKCKFYVFLLYILNKQIKTNYI
jgi:hypothetical protein